ncbi:DUF3021 domain-containing protein [Sporolactobacillus sp. THM7-7]|nr:DUF3021 domain-containing protein [Sporolactobacillus sp. THM7-7]
MMIWKVFGKAVRNILIGFGLAAIATVIFLFSAINDEQTILDTGILLKEMIGSMMFGAYCGMTAFIYDWKKIGPLRQTAIHFPLMIAGFYVAGTSLGWFHLVLWPLLFFLAVYLLIWLYFFLYNWFLARRLNKGLKK